MFRSTAQFIIRLRIKILRKSEREHFVIHWDYDIVKFTVFRRVEKLAESD
jgi:hypothetical protein